MQLTPLRLLHVIMHLFRWPQPACDVYSLGVVLFIMLIGEWPYRLGWAVQLQ